MRIMILPQQTTYSVSFIQYVASTDLGRDDAGCFNAHFGLETSGRGVPSRSAHRRGQLCWVTGAMSQRCRAVNSSKL